MNGHVSKPIDPDELFAALLRWIPARADTAEQPATTAATPRETSLSDDAIGAIPGLDINAGLRRVLNKRAAYENLLRRFTSAQAEAAALIRSQLAAGERESAQRTAHTLKGIAGTIGAALLQKHAGAVEHAIQMGQPATEIEGPLVTAETELARLVSALKLALPPEQAAPAASEIDWVKAKEIVGRIETLLADDDSEAVELFTEHAQLLHAACGTAAAVVEKDLARFMFVDALAALREARARISQLH